MSYTNSNQDEYNQYGEPGAGYTPPPAPFAQKQTDATQPIGQPQPNQPMPPGAAVPASQPYHQTPSYFNQQNGQPGEYNPQVYQPAQPYAQQPYGQPNPYAPMPAVYGGQPGYHVPTTHAGTLASIGRRFGAYLLDGILLYIVGTILGVVFNIENSLVNVVTVGSSFTAVFIYMLIGLLIPLLYYGIAYSTGGQTLGKKALRIRVVRRDRVPLNIETGFRRTVIINLYSIFSFIMGLFFFNQLTFLMENIETIFWYLGPLFLVGLVQLLDYLWAFWDVENQTLHDKFADTLVVNT